MQPTGISPGTIRVLANTAPDLLSELFTPGRILEAEVVSVFGEKAMLNLGRNLRVEVTLQTPLREGQKVQVQVQPQERPAVPGEAQPPIVLKVLGQAPQAPARAPGAMAAPLQEAALPPSQTQPGQPNQPQVQWVPIPLPQGGQAWAQVQVQEEGPRKARGKGGPVHQVRIYWETPGLGPIQVTLDAARTSLTALFTAATAESRKAVEQHLPELQERLNEAGFTETRLGARQPMPGEAVEPVRPDEPGRLNRRM